jgi:hypothetical protein
LNQHFLTLPLSGSQNIEEIKSERINGYKIEIDNDEIKQEEMVKMVTIMKNTREAREAVKNKIFIITKN